MHIFGLKRSQDLAFDSLDGLGSKFISLWNLATGNVAPLLLSMQKNVGGEKRWRKTLRKTRQLVPTNKRTFGREINRVNAIECAHPHVCRQNEISTNVSCRSLLENIEFVDTYDNRTSAACFSVEIQFRTV